ncbi:hypothetical protein [Roseobacter weihaiensis]|uniref:hypothetical protein n=1 Tax=Roseobacter weihaiensis TaxID=2763262 RepID=UPI001D0AA89F|nr:hypothetical protein [Roseobacter sp. H9]
MTIRFLAALSFVWCGLLSDAALAEPMRVLWWDVTVNDPGNEPALRREMAEYLGRLDEGGRYSVVYKYEPRRGAFARHMATTPGYQLIVLTAANRDRIFNDDDLAAFQSFYASGSKALMLDGTLPIRNVSARRLTQWPGVNNSSANLLENQLDALRQAGGGLLIGTDHNIFQVPANTVLAAILPQAQFSRSTDPSRDGAFFGDLLLAGREPVKPLDILRHWETIPNQGQAPVGRFVDFTGQPVTLYALVEASDKPGGGERRPYISATIDPGTERFDIASDVTPEIDRMPTRKSLPAN